jgi:hypothetical protein
MPKLIPEPLQRQLTGLTNMTAHARHLYQVGVYDRSDLYKIEAFEAEQRAKIADTESYVRMRQDGTWDKLEQVLNHPRSAQRQSGNFWLGKQLAQGRPGRGQLSAAGRGRAESGDGRGP